MRAKTLLVRARIAHGRVLTNSETNSIKKEYIDKLMVEREAEANRERTDVMPFAASFFLSGLR
ncbi:DUF3811 domain-containing protein [Escherichia fergusonii]|nr:DUF3811 domain-containing protein [Escherichia fergusonii]